jgi:uncharacterized protein (TIGR02466 family)
VLKTAQPIFVTPLWVFASDLSQSELDGLETLALSVEKRSSGLVKSNNEFAHHSEINYAGSFMDLPGSKRLATVFRRCLTEYDYSLKSIKIDYWSIISRKYAYNAAHNHGGALLSAVLYVRVPSGSGFLRFHDPRSAKVMCPTVGQDSGSLLHQSVKVDPKEGLIAIFPSFLVHDVTMTLAEEPRIIFSFNIFPIEGGGSLEQ